MRLLALLAFTSSALAAVTQVGYAGEVYSEHEYHGQVYRVHSNKCSELAHKVHSIKVKDNGICTLFFDRECHHPIKRYVNDDPRIDPPASDARSVKCS
ncbi:hypothetical protein TOPH_00374 [Tolypocladium ophioglossoides CBS 100239]|uniref:Uncharacterized protein n=1 Tax=Tolypocladium ophioglossoides (strain CBS 100239) TaxID=1163406 RepID=A0A0L0NMV3_TOLOC|nr:hypothetical protein TOPH_00374 [Tolypocladium ophioglossoides CBS 100239]